MKRLDLAGQVINGIQVLELVGVRKFTEFRCRCHCGTLFVTRGVRLTSSETKSCGCLSAGYMRTRDGVTQQNKLWRAAVRKRDKDTCRKCGGTECIGAHHILCKHIVPEKRFDIDNGAALCIVCHMRFHRLYGYGHTTDTAFKEWINEAKRTYA